MKKLILSSLAGGVFAFFFGWLVYGMLLSGLMKEFAGPGNALVALPENEMRMGFILLSNMMYGLLLSFIFIRMQISDISAGMKTGAIIALIATLWVDSSMFSMTTLYTLPGMALDCGVSLLMGAATGAVVTWVMRKVK